MSALVWMAKPSVTSALTQVPRDAFESYWEPQGWEEVEPPGGGPTGPLWLQVAENLADVPDKAAARANLGITGGGDVLAANNLSDLANAAAARTNLGLGTAATQASAAFQVADSDLTAIAGLTPTDGDVVQRVSGAWTNRTAAQVKTSLSLAKADVGLGAVDNTADTAKPISAAQQTALDGKTDLTIVGQQALATQRATRLQGWYAALAARDYARANIVCVGDSITEGQGATVLDRRYVARLAALLRARYPTTGVTSGGRGYLGGALTGTTSFAATSFVTVAGSVGNQSDYGPKRGIRTLTGAGQSLTWALTGTAADIMWVRAGSGGTFSYAVDGGSATNVSTTGSTADGQLTRVSLGAAGAHTLTVAYVSGGTCFIDGVIEYNGDENAGIMVHDAGHYGWASTEWAAGSLPNYQFASALKGLSPSLYYLQIGTNDLATNVNPTTFQTNVTSLISQLRSPLSTPYPPIVLGMIYQRSGTFTYTWAQYLAAAYAIAAADSQVLVLDHTLRMPSVAASATYSLYADTVHPSDRGMAMLADTAAAFLAPA